MENKILKITILVATALAGYAYFHSEHQSSLAKVVVPTMKREVEISEPQKVSLTKSEGAPSPKVFFPRRDFELIRDLEKKIFLSEAEKAELDRALAADSTINFIQSAMMSPRYLEKRFFNRRIDALNILYQGLKSVKDQTKQAYIVLAEQLMKQIPDNSRLTQFQRQQFIGDRVEIALFVAKLNGDLARQIEMASTADEPKAKVYFQRARELAQVYEFSL